MNCWILCLPRSGSTYLSDLLNSTNLFPIYKDHRLKDICGPIQSGMAFNEWLRIFSNYDDFLKNPPMCCKAIYHQYLEVVCEIQQKKRRMPSKYYKNIELDSEDFAIKNFNLIKLKKSIENIKFIYLKRDLFEQSISTYFARKTLKYHIYSKKDQYEYLNHSIDIDLESILKIYYEIQKLKDCWEKFFFENMELINVDYSDLINDPNKTIKNILDFLNLEFTKYQLEQSMEKFTNESRTFKMTRKDSEKLSEKLKNIAINHSEMPKIFL